MSCPPLAERGVAVALGKNGRQRLRRHGRPLLSRDALPDWPVGLPAERCPGATRRGGELGKTVPGVYTRVAWSVAPDTFHPPKTCLVTGSVRTQQTTCNDTDWISSARFDCAHGTRLSA